MSAFWNTMRQPAKRESQMGFGNYFGLLNIEIDIQAPMSMVDSSTVEKEREIKAAIAGRLNAIVEDIKKILPDGRVFLAYHR